MSVFRVGKKSKKKIMDNVDLITVEGDKITLSGLFEENKIITGTIKKIDNERHEISIT